MTRTRRITGLMAAAILIIGLAFLARREPWVRRPVAPELGSSLDTAPMPPGQPEGAPPEGAESALEDPDEGSPDAVDNASPSVSLLVTDPDGSPVPGAWVELFCHRAEGDEFEVTDVVKGETGGDGSLRLEVPASVDRFRLDVTPPDEEVLLPVRIEPWDPEKSPILLREALRLTGRVVDPSRAPVPGTQVFLTVDETGDNSDTHSDVNGEFEFRGLAPGEVKLEVRYGTRTAGSDRLARAGDLDVRLVVKSGGVAVVRVEGAVYDSDMGVIVCFDEQAGEFLRYWSRPDREGRLFLPGLDPEKTYTLWAGPFIEGGHLYRKGLRPGTETTLSLTKGAELKGRVVWPESRLPYHIGIYIKSEGVWTSTQVGRGGVFTFPSVPPGAWRVEVSAAANEGKLTGSEVIKTGEPGVVHIR
jgi:hypothetical protein